MQTASFLSPSYGTRDSRAESCAQWPLHRRWDWANGKGGPNTHPGLGAFLSREGGYGKALALLFFPQNGKCCLSGRGESHDNTGFWKSCATRFHAGCLGALTPCMHTPRGGQRRHLRVVSSSETAETRALSSGRCMAELSLGFMRHPEWSRLLLNCT